MSDETICAWLLSLCALLRPAIAVAPPGWYVEGVRPNGSTIFRPAPIGRECDGAVACASDAPPPGGVAWRIYCTGGSRPIVVNAQTVACQARH